MEPTLTISLEKECRGQVRLTCSNRFSPNFAMLRLNPFKTVRRQLERYKRTDHIDVKNLIIDYIASPNHQISQNLVYQ